MDGHQLIGRNFFLNVNLIFFFQSQDSWEKFVVSTFSKTVFVFGYFPHRPTVFAKWYLQLRRGKFVVPIFLEITDHISLPWFPWQHMPIFLAILASVLPLYTVVSQGSVLDFHYLHPTPPMHDLTIPETSNTTDMLIIITHIYSQTICPRFMLRCSVLMRHL